MRFHVARDINVGLLFVIGVSSLGLFGIVLGGWASNSHYSIMGAIRSTAQLVSYETAAGLALVSGVLLAGTLSIHAIVDAQYDRRRLVHLSCPRGILHLCRGFHCRNESRSV